MAQHNTSNFTDKNNVLAGTAGSLEAIEEPNSRYDFGIKWAGDDGDATVSTFNLTPPNQPSVGLLQGTFPMNPDFGEEAYIDGMGWDSGSAVISVDWEVGTLAGTIKEKYYGSTFPVALFTDTRVLLAERDNVDPGYGDIGEGRDGQKYSFVITGTEFRIYNSRELSPVFILASPTVGAGFPLSLGAWVNGASPGFYVTDIRIVRIRADTFSTIYSVRDQVEDFGVQQTTLHARIYQNRTPPLTVDGVPTDIDF